MTPPSGAYPIDKAAEIVDLMGSLLEADRGDGAAPKDTYRMRVPGGWLISREDTPIAPHGVVPDLEFAMSAGAAARMGAPGAGPASP